MISLVQTLPDVPLGLADERTGGQSIRGMVTRGLDNSHITTTLKTKSVQQDEFVLDFA